MKIGQKVIEALVNRGFYFTDHDTKLAEEAVDKELVAYMPVPRCETCANWVNGICKTIGISPGPDFGCVQWKAKSLSTEEWGETGGEDTQ